MNVREKVEEIEEKTLSEFAVKSRDSVGRPRYEAPDDVRTCFQRDRDRIIHCKAFRRLKHKTQVFLDPEEDHYRTRLTHTLEVAQIARTLSRALQLNDDLTEAIALAHDLGHTPFGHAGETALEQAMKEFDPSAKFRHYDQSLRVVDFLERRGEGLNLSEEVRDGISNHSKGRAAFTEDEFAKTNSLEAACVRYADRIAYVNHDLDDAIRAGILTNDDIPSQILDNLGQTHSKRIGAMATDILTNSENCPEIRMSDTMRDLIDLLKEFLFEKVYLGYSPVQIELEKAKNVVVMLFRAYMEAPETLPEQFQPKSAEIKETIQSVCDYIAGMTDRYAVQRFEILFVPRVWNINRL